MIVISEITIFRFKWLFHQTSFQSTKTKANNAQIKTGNIQERKVFMIYSDDPNKFNLKSLIKQSNDRIVSVL